MARGRSIEKTLQPSRALAQQRDYRARKAAKMESLENEVQLLRAENDRLRAELREARSGDNGQDIGEAVINVRQCLIRALDAVNALSSGLPAKNEGILRGTVVEGGSLFELTERTQANEGCKGTGERPGKEEVMNNNTMLESRHDPGCCSGLFDCSSVPPIPTTDRPSAHEHKAQRYPTSSFPDAFRSHSQTSPTLDPSSRIITPPILVQPDPILVEIGFDAACCGGVMDCSHLSRPIDAQEEEEGEDQLERGISHVRAEGRGR